MMIHITSASNERYAPGLIVAISSSLYYLDKNIEVTVHILNSGLSKKSIQKLEDVCNKTHPKCTLIIIDFNDCVFAGATLGPGNSYLTYARLLIASLVNSDKVIYLDCDVLVIRDLLEIWQMDMEGKTILAAPNYPPTKLGDDCPFQISESENKLLYINCGVLLINLSDVRKSNSERKLIDLALKYKCNYWDQTVINYFYRHNIKLLAECWNWQDENIVLNKNIISGILHYSMKRKPWLYFNSTLKDRLWHFHHNKLIGNYFLFAVQNYNWLDTIKELKKYIIRRYSIFRKLYLSYLSVKDGNLHNRHAEYYKNSDITLMESNLFKSYKLQCK